MYIFGKPYSKYFGLYCLCPIFFLGSLKASATIIQTIKAPNLDTNTTTKPDFLSDGVQVSIDQLSQMLVSTSVDYKTAKSKENQQTSALWQAGFSLGPTVSIQNNLNINNAVGVSTSFFKASQNGFQIPSFNPNNPGPNFELASKNLSVLISEPVSNFLGQSALQIQAASASLDSAHLNTISVLQSTSLQMYNSVLDYYANQENYRVAMKIYQDSRLGTNISYQQWKNGFQPQENWLKAKANESQNYQNAVSTLFKWQSAELALQNILVTQTTIVLAKTDMDAWIGKIHKIAIPTTIQEPRIQRPDIVGLRKAATAAKLNYETNVLSYVPTINANASFSREIANGGSSVSQYGLSLNWNLWTGFQRENQLWNSSESAKQADWQYDKNNTAWRLALQNDVFQLRLDQASIDASQQSVADNAKVYAQVQQQWYLGNNTIYDYLVAQNQYLQAENQYVTAKVQQAKDTLQYCYDYGIELPH
jgi:outer membrane protein TolC